MRKKEIVKDPGITKEEAVKELINRGYDAKYEDHLVRVYAEENRFQDTIREVTELFGQINYKRSFGFAQKKPLTGTGAQA